jgi:release factor glutamine methyltransferase
LASALQAQPIQGTTVADLCTGSGALAIVAAQAGAARVVAVDVSRRAALAARVNARINARADGCRVEVRRGDLFGALRGERFDVIVCNPPYVPAATDALPRHRPTTPLDGGTDGRALLDRLCREAPAHLRRGGTLLIVHSSVCGVEKTCERLAERHLEARVVTRVNGPLGPVLRARAPMLRARGLLGERDEEELVVVRACAA